MATCQLCSALILQSCLHLFEGLFKVSHLILHVFNTDTQSNQGVGDMFGLL